MEIPERLTAVFRNALADSKFKDWVDYRRIEGEEAARLKAATGEDFTGWTHVFDADTARHIHGGHGVGNETRGNHLPITEEDIKRIPEIVQDHDSVKLQGSGLVYKKKINGHVFFVEEKRQGRKKLAAKSMWKIGTGALGAIHPEGEASSFTSETFPGHQQQDTTKQGEAQAGGGRAEVKDRPASELADMSDDDLNAAFDEAVKTVAAEKEEPKKAPESTAVPSEDDDDLRRMDYKIAGLKDKIARLGRIVNAPMQTPGSYITGGSNRPKSLDRAHDREVNRYTDANNEYLKALKDLEFWEGRRRQYAAENVHANGQPKADRPERREEKALKPRYAAWVRSVVKPGDLVLLTVNDQTVAVEKMNKTTWTAKVSDTKWEYLDLLPIKEDGTPFTMREAGAALTAFEKTKPAAEKTAKPQVAETKPRRKSQTEILADIAKDGVTGVEESVKALYELFGGGRIGILPAGLDEESYRRARPHIDKMYRAFSDAGKGVREFLEALVRNFGEAPGRQWPVHGDFLE